MNGEPEHFRMVRLHKAWADRYTILWSIIIVVQFGGFYIVLGEIQTNPLVRTDILILLAVMTLTVVVWQAVGLGVARVHMLIAGIDLEKLAEAARRRHK
jgi:hypothetical protein